ncbi:MAG: iron-sulfur cluster repair di-iron protein [Blastocatellia bacterium]
MITTISKTLSDYASNVPGAVEIFEEFGLDYCCGGGRMLDQACAEIGLTVDEVLTKLSQAEENKKVKSEFIDWSKESLTNLVNYILTTHHIYTKQEIEQLPKLLTKVIIAHEENHPELKKLAQILQTLVDDLDQHMMKEEQVLFPYITALEKSKTQSEKLPTACFGTVKNPIRVMMFEHDTAGDLLKNIRLVTSDYTIPTDVCPSFRSLYQRLQDLEQDLHKHIHLENNILFPQIIELENKIFSKI